MEFAGYHDFAKRDERQPDCFVVFRVDDGWYWQLMSQAKEPRGMPVGPFVDDEQAYIHAMR